MGTAASGGRRFFVPEIVQISATDCGPAALASALVGHGIATDYARLREACQTSVDGTSIDTLEEIAVRLGLDAAQYIQRSEDILLREAENFPALLVTRLPEGALHFVVAWRRVGDFVQIMDPGRGRSWVPTEALQRTLHIHQQEVDAEAFFELAVHGPFAAVLERRLAKLLGATGRELLQAAVASRDWAELASLDATARLTAQLVEAGALRQGEPTRTAFSRLHRQARAEAASDVEAIPEHSWSVRPSPRGDAGRLLWGGAVALRLLGRQEAEPRESLPPDLRASLEQRARSPLWALFELLPRERTRAALLFGLGTLIAVFGVVMQTLAVRSLLGVDQLLLLPRQRLFGLLGYGLLLLLLIAGSFASESFLLRAGRQLEIRLWAALLEKVPRLPERFFQSRLVTDLADRAQSVHHLRNLPVFVFNTLQVVLELSVSVVALALADPRSLPAAALAFATALSLPLLFAPLLAERDMRLHTHLVALSRQLLDVLLGAVPLRAHAAQRPLKREQEVLLAEWAHASRSALRGALTLSGLHAFLSTLLLVILVYGYAARHPALSAGIIVVLYWGGRLPTLAQRIVELWREYPMLCNVAARLMEPLEAPEEATKAAAEPAAPPTRSLERGPRVEFRNASVKVSGKRIVKGVSLEISAGSHVAIVGRSGAGKSTLLGLLTGWYPCETGELNVDGQRLEGAELERLRVETAWVDPAVQLWNRPLLDNVRYGSAREPSAGQLGRVMDDAELIDVIERLALGMQTPIGEGGRLLSGGEGQRVRFARALLRPRARLVLLDEPFRGLARDVRQRLLQRARNLWSHATLLCVTHDLAETTGFDRVIVLEDGAVVEDGSPTELRDRPDSRYLRLLEAEGQAQRALLEAKRWRRFVFQDGRLQPFEAES